MSLPPGCGKEDFHLGKEQGLPPVAPLDDAGAFLPGFGWLEGLSAVETTTADRILEDLKQKGRLFASEQYPHSYPHCWRCKTELLFRLVDEWFINMKWRGEIMDVTRQVTFLPESIGGQPRELKWLEQMGDWMISKKRFWGLALPIWVCDSCGGFDVIGSRDELQKRAVSGWDKFDGQTPHRPFVDQIKIKCGKCSGQSSRIPDVGNPWLDAGIVPYSTMYYNRDKTEWAKWFPAAFITESFPGQFRNWFYAILAMSTMMENRPPFQTLLGHALVRDERGETMSKSKGNSIEFNEAADKMGADVMRWLYCRTNPATNINFGYGPADEIRAKFFIKLWNVYAFFVNYARLDGFDPNAAAVPSDRLAPLDQWILSDLQVLKKRGLEAYDSFDLMTLCEDVERFVDDKLSNWYVRQSRRRFWDKIGATNAEAKLAAYQSLYTVLRELSRLCAPVIPFVTEAMWSNLRNDSDPISVHLCEVPQVDHTLVNDKVSEAMNRVLDVVRMGHAARKNAKIRVRQPLSKLTLVTRKGIDLAAGYWFSADVRRELNVKNFTLELSPRLEKDAYYVARPIAKKLAPKCGKHYPEVVKHLEGLKASVVSLASHLGRTLTIPTSSGELILEPTDFYWEFTPPADEPCVAVYEGDNQVILDTHITPDLAAEGLAREVIRHIQDVRKNAGLELEDKIDVNLETNSSAIKAAIDKHWDFIASETQATRQTQAIEDYLWNEPVNIEGMVVVIQVKKEG
jgi:isoleucyl-tRNA synthetase